VSWDIAVGRWQDGSDDRLGTWGRVLLRAGVLTLVACLPFSIVGMNIGGVLAIVGGLMARVPLHRAPGRWFMVAFALWQFASMLVTGQLLQVPGQMWHWLLMPLVAVALRDARWRGLALRLLAVSCIVAVTLALVQMVVGFGGKAPFRVALPAAGGVRWWHGSGFFSTHLTFGFVMAVMVLIWLSVEPLAISRRWAMGVVAFLGLGLSEARSAFIGILAAAVVPGRSLREWLHMMALGVVAVGVLGGLALVLSPERMYRALTFQDPRLAIWQVAGGVIADRPWFGCGGMKPYSPIYMQKLADLTGGATQMPFTGLILPNENPLVGSMHAHNSYMSIAAGYGLPAAVLHLALMAVLALHFWRLRIKAPAAARLGLQVLAAFIAAGLFEYVVGDSESSMAAWAAMGLALGMAGDPGRSERIAGAGPSAG